jgi:hypothetical protein
MFIWNRDAQGRPEFEYVVSVLRDLLEMSQSNRISPFPREAFYSVESCLSISETGAPINMSDHDFWSIAAIDVATSKLVHTLDGRTNETVENSSIWTSVLNSGSSPLREHDRFCASFGILPSKRGMGRFQLRVPDSLSGLGSWASCNLQGQGVTDTHVHLSTDIMSTGWWTGAHIEYPGGCYVKIHLEGTVLWITYPRNEINAKLMDASAEHAFGQDQVDILTVMKKLDQVQVHVSTRPEAFILNPFEYCACICLKSSLHIGGSVWFQRHVLQNCTEISRMINRWSSDLGLSRELVENVKKINKGAMAAMKKVSQRHPKCKTQVAQLDKHLKSL